MSCLIHKHLELTNGGSVKNRDPCTSPGCCIQGLPRLIIKNHMRKYINILCSVLALINVFGLAGCGVISNLESMRASMDQMAYYTGLMATNMPVMAHSTSRIADTAVKMDRKTDEIFQSLEKRATSIDRNIVGTSQDTIAQTNNMIKELSGIKSELSKITTSLQRPQTKSDTVHADAEKINAMEQKLKSLEKQLIELEVKVKQADKRP